MKVKELIEVFKAMPPEAEVWHLWDGDARTAIRYVWLSKGGQVITADASEVCYRTEVRPSGAPTSEQDRYWQTPESEDEGGILK